MKENKLSRRSFVRVSTASVAALSVPALVGAQSDAPQQDLQQHHAFPFSFAAGLSQTLRNFP